MIKLLFGRFFWMWGVAFLLTSGYLGAQIVKNIRSLWVAEPPPKAKGKLAWKNKRHTLRKKNSSVVLSSQNIFDPQGGMITPQEKQPEKTDKKDEKKKETQLKKTNVAGCPPFDPKGQYKESKMPKVRLKGVSYVARAPNLSMAAVYVRVEHKPIAYIPGAKKRKGKRVTWEIELFRVGDKIMDAQLCAIRRKEVLIYRRSKMQKLSLNRKKKGRKEWFYGAIGLQNETKGPGEVKAEATDNFTISRKTVNDWLTNPMQHAMSARIMPERGGKGFRLVWVRKNSLYSQIGLKSGDVVQQINGKNISIGSALGMYSQLPYAKKLQVNIIRKGVRRSIMYRIK